MTVAAVVDDMVAMTLVGAPGAVAMSSGALGAEAGPVPMTLVAVTVNVYVAPVVRPETVHVVAPVVVQVNPPVLEVTV